MTTTEILFREMAAYAPETVNVQVTVWRSVKIESWDEIWDEAVVTRWFTNRDEAEAFAADEMAKIARGEGDGERVTMYVTSR